ncbi:TPA: M15 family metallopeptidase, partial [Stenotrophomonas maltophilia]
MHRRPLLLLNTEAIELWPADLLRARSNLDARLLARARWVLRRKRDGRYLAAVLTQGVHSLVPRLPHEPGVEEALALLDARASRPFAAALEQRWLPLAGLQQRLQHLGLDAQGYADDTGLPLEAEPCLLHFAG